MTLNQIIILITAFYVLSSTSLFSQDVILKKDRDSIFAKILEINSDEISFKKTNNLNGPIYTLPKSEILKITFENGVSESYTVNDSGINMNIEQTKLFLKENIDKYCFDRSGKRSIIAEFEGDLLMFYWKSKNSNSEPKERYLFDFSQECKFHNLSKRGDDIAFINAYIPRLIKNDIWSNEHKLIIRVQGYDNASKVLEAMEHYHMLLSNN